jgi:hypothetical protein
MFGHCRAWVETTDCFLFASCHCATKIQRRPISLEGNRQPNIDMLYRDLRPSLYIWLPPAAGRQMTTPLDYLHTYGKAGQAVHDRLLISKG